MESWQSGRLRQSRKLLRVKPPGVRIPNSPLKFAYAKQESVIRIENYTQASIRKVAGHIRKVCTNSQQVHTSDLFSVVFSLMSALS